MATIALLVGGALVNALAFSGSNFLFSSMRRQHVDEEKERHDRAVEQLQTGQAEWSRKRIARLDFVNEDLRRQGHAVHTFQDVDQAIREYSMVTGKQLDSLGGKPRLSDFYTPSDDQRDREIAFVVAGMAVTGLVAYQLI